MIRRTITVGDGLNGLIQKIRGFLIGQDREVDYTTMMNMLASIGLLRFLEPKSWTPGEETLFNYYMTSDQFKYESAVDLMWDQYIRQLPEIIQNIIDTRNRQTRTQ